ncbi:CGNR zinc finger protein [Kribbella sp. VKM Ac-2527]|uniref:CGNR zinc finger protein n=1 Tax=Kribbella caucasensis TaxID=2512215 RepID=A0A4R6KIM8_9ACTN|nr:CGNR zinc finger domain-containing protein [Kribbella sp. VKM Ac-2527]TDO50567.1 CGNR zinc finger protein [Kribbella sp. VKM Ac-2527]
MDATDHLRASLDAAVALANSFGGEFAQGRPRPAGDAAAVEAALRLTTNRLPEIELQPFAVGGRDLYASLRRIAEGEVDAAATSINDLLESTRAAPRLVRREGPWHLHFVSPGVSAATGWLAEFATATAMLLGSDERARLRICDADRCDNLFLDATRSRTQRFCSPACQNRTKVAAHRARSA